MLRLSRTCRKQVYCVLNGAFCSEQAGRFVSLHKEVPGCFIAYQYEV